MATFMIINMYGEVDSVDLDLIQATQISVGRDSSRNHIVMLDPVVSGSQLVVWRDGSGYSFRDAGSSNGTMFERKGQRYLFSGPSSSTSLVNGDVLRIGDPDNPKRQTLILYTDRGSADDWTQYAIGERPVTIGSHPNCLIPTPVQGAPGEIGRLVRTGEYECRLEIFGAAPGMVRVNGLPAANGMLIHEKDVLSFYGRRVIYSRGSLFYRKKTDGISLSAEHITKLVPAGGKNLFSRKKKKILDDVSLTIKPNQFVAIIGGSGAGKTTLMNALSAFDPNFSGSVKLNGTDLVDKFDSFKSEIGYVPQQDILYEEFPLDKMLESAAKLRMPQSATKEQIKARVHQVLQMVDLSQHEKTIISKLSGGQKKRASIAVELLSDPQLFFLDEPTSGLDPGTEKALMLTLNQLAKEYNKTIIMVTHNINNLEKCDQVIMMEPGGRLAFMGPVAQAKSYFGTSELSDVYSILAKDRNGQYGQQWRMRPKSVSRTQNSPQTLRPRERDSFFHQFGVLVARYFSLLFRKKSLLALLIVQPVIIALLLGMVASEDVFAVYDDTKSMLFSLACAAIWLGLFDTIQDICSERTIIKREYMNKLKIPSYLAAKLVVFSCIGLIQALLLTGIFMTMTGADLEGIVLGNGLVEMVLIVFLTILASQALGFVVSALSRSPEKAMVSAPFLLIIQLLFSGILFKLEGFGKFISYFTISKWSVEGLGSVADLNGLPSRVELDFKDFPIDEREVEEVFKSTAGHLWLVVIILIIFVIVELIATAVALRQIKNDQR